MLKQLYSLLSAKNDKLTITKIILTYTKTILSKIKFQGGVEVCLTQQPYKN